jgi:hypothetical protein
MLVLSTMWGSAAAADAPPPAFVESDAEGVLDYHRDGGLSVPLAEPFAGQSLWIFDDTGITDAAGNPLIFVPGSHAAIGAATTTMVPTVREIPEPGTGAISPTPLSPPLGLSWFLPASPPDIRLPDNEGTCGAQGTDTYSANWTLGATRGPNAAMTVYDGGTTPVALTASQASEVVFIVYFGVCVHVGDPWPEAFHIQRTSMGAYDPTTNSFLATWDVFDTNSPAPTGDLVDWQQQLWHPQFSGSYMYVYASICDNFNTLFAACMSGPVVVLRAPISTIHDESTYRYWTGSSPGTIDAPANWSSDADDAVSIVPTSGGGPLQVHVADFSSTGDGYLLMEQTSLGLNYRLYQASSPVGPWTLVRNAQAPGCAPVTGAGCYALTGHPELSSPTQLLYSFYDQPDGELEVVSLAGVP